MRLALITPDWPDFAPGGVAAINRTLAAGLAELGVEIEVWTRGGGRRGRLVRGAEQPCPVRLLPGRGWRRRGSDLWARGLRRELARFAPDVALVSPWEPLVGGLDFAPRVVVFAHGREITGELDGARSAARERVLAAPLRWLFLTGWMGQQLAARGVPAERRHRVPAAVPAPPAQARGGGGLLCVGRLIPRKGQDTLLQACALLRPRYPRLRCHVVGGGPDHQRLVGLRGDLGLIDNVTLHGHLPPEELERRWSQADLFVMPARDERAGDREGFGLVYLETGARGLASVGGRAGGVPEAVLHGQTGLLADGPQELAEAIARLLDDGELRARLGAAGRRRWERGGRPRDLARAVLDLL